MTDFKFHANDKFLNGQKLAWICISFTRDPRKRASFCKENSTAICYRICTVRCKRFAQVKNPSFQKFVRNRLNGVFEVLDPNRSSLSSPCKRTQLCWMLWICCILFSLRSARRISGRRLNALALRRLHIVPCCWELLHKVLNRSNFQLRAATVNIVGPTMLGVVASVCT